MIRGMEVKINSAERVIVLRLAENNRQLLVQGDAVTQMRPAVLVGFDRLFHQRLDGGFAIFRRLVEANDELLVSLHRIGNLLLECSNSHNRQG